MMAEGTGAPETSMYFPLMIVLVVVLVIVGVFLPRWRRRRRLQEHKVTINLTCPICGEVMSAPVVPPPLLHAGVKVGQTATCPSCGKASLVGIAYLGGWLLFPAIGLILGPVQSILSIAGLGGVSAVAVGVGFIMFQVFVAVLFFMKKPLAPKLVIALIIVNLASVLALWGLDAGVARDVAYAFVGAAVWIPYFLVSRRVKATFGRRGIAWPIQQGGVIVSQVGGSATTPPKSQT